MRCFLIEPTGIYEVHVTAYWPGCPIDGNQHFGEAVIFTGPEAEAEKVEGLGKEFLMKCSGCGAEKELRATSSGRGPFYRRTDTGETKRRIAAFGPGAMWYAPWYRSENGLYMPWDWDNQTEPPLMVTCPGGHDWNIDSRASNCTMPNDKLHRCWIRHGAPPNITVDKNGFTCQAGAGSIVAGKYHGFLRNGEFTPPL